MRLFSFLAFIAYAITNHQLFSIRVIAAESLTFVMWLALFIDLITARGFQEIITNTIPLFIVIPFGIFLVRSVLNEVQQKEKLMELNLKLNENTVELNTQLAEIERMNKYMVDRELKMVELKRENEELKGELSGR